MDIRYTHHALQRMRQRKVSEEQVVETLTDPDDLIRGELGEFIAVRRFGVREVRVVYGDTDTNTVVIYTVINQRIRFPHHR